MVSCTWTTISIILWITACSDIEVVAVSQECDASTDGTCIATGTTLSSSCHHDVNICTEPITIYGSGGTAVAYVPNQPISSVICDASDSTMKSNPYRLAKWPFSRSSKTRKFNDSHATVAPTIQLKINILGCQQTVSSSSSSPLSKTKSSPFSYFSKSKKEDIQQSITTCCCQQYKDENDIEIDIWQTRPDGTYTSLKSATTNHDIKGECRARGIITKGENPSITFTTLAPGSAGALNGLGPNKYDMMPYGPPVMHILIQSKSYSTTLLDIPILINFNTLQPISFYGSDFRGPAWVQPKSHSSKKLQPSKQPYNITVWKPFIEQNHIEMELDLYIPRNIHHHNITTTTTTSIPSKKSKSIPKQLLNQILCPSYLYGLPTSFFLEPIAVCAPSILDFFDL
jgi:hypothetical protein